MGNEIGQLREWDESREQDWDILQYPKHDSFARFMQDLNKLYLKTPALSAEDYSQNGFEWIDCHQEDRCIYAFERKSSSQKIAAVFNFSDQQQVYMLPITEGRRLKLLLSSEDEQYGGKAKCQKEGYLVQDGYAMIELPAFSGMYFKVLSK